MFKGLSSSHPKRWLVALFKFPDYPITQLPISLHLTQSPSPTQMILSLRTLKTSNPSQSLEIADRTDVFWSDGHPFARFWRRAGSKMGGRGLSFRGRLSGTRILELLRVSGAAIRRDC